MDFDRHQKSEQLVDDSSLIEADDEFLLENGERTLQLEFNNCKRRGRDKCGTQHEMKSPIEIQLSLGGEENGKIVNQETIETTSPPSSPKKNGNIHRFRRVHCHPLEVDDFTSQKVATRKLVTTLAFCFLFMIVELVGGIFANSLVIMSDAAHLLTDMSSFALSLFAIWISKKEPTKRFSFGYYRMEILGAIMSTFFIWILTAFLVFTAIERIRQNDYEINSSVMMIVAGIGVLVNVIMGIVLNDFHCGCNRSHENDDESQFHSHSHFSSVGSHGHSHMNMNVRAAFIHILGDLLQSVGALIAAIVIHFKPDYKIADPICTFVFSIIVIATTFSILKDAFYILMEAFPKTVDYQSVKQSLEDIEGVKMVHSLHIWTLALDKAVLSVHLAISGSANADDVLRKAEHLMRNTYGIYRTTIQIEKYDASTMTTCVVCLSPQK